MSSPLADAWERVEAEVNLTPYAYKVCIATPLPPVLPYRAQVELNYLPDGHKRRRTERIDAEGLTLAEALNELADALAAWRTR